MTRSNAGRSTTGIASDDARKDMLGVEGDMLDDFFTMGGALLVTGALMLLFIGVVLLVEPSGCNWALLPK